MDRRDFLKSAGAAGAVASVFGELSPALRAEPVGTTGITVRTVREYDVPSEGVTRVAAKPDAVTSIRYPEATLSVGLMAQYVLDGVAKLLPHPCVLADEMSSRRESGLTIGHIIISDAPGAERWAGKRPVTIERQVSVVLVAPFHFNGDRRAAYSIMKDRMEDVPVMVAEPVELAKLAVVIDSLTKQIRHQQLDVFTAQMPLPRVGSAGPACEAAETVLSQKLGLAVRVIRMCARESLVMRFDLLGGRYPSESVSVT